MRNDWTYPHRRRRGGFTLLEIMIAIALFSICTAMAATGFARVINVTVSAARSGSMHRSIRHGLSILSRDVLEAKHIHSYSNNDFIILQKTSSSGDYFVYYLLHNQRLFRFTSTQPGSQILGRNIDRVRLDYFDLDSDPVTTPAEAVIVNIRVGGVFNHRNNIYRDRVETRVRLRNKPV